MSTTWPDVWAEVKKAARQAPRLYAAPFIGAVSPSIARLRRTAGVSTLNQIDSAKWSAISNANQAIAAIAAKYPKLKMHADDTKHDMERLLNLTSIGSPGSRAPGAAGRQREREGRGGHQQVRHTECAPFY